MLRSGRFALATVLGLFVVLAAAASQAGPTTDLTFEEAAKRLHYNPDDRSALRSERIIATDVKRTRDDQLIAAVCLLLPVPLQTIQGNVERGLNIELDPDVQAFGELSPDAGEAQFAALGYSASEAQEARALLAVEPGERFNLSKAEGEALRRALGSLDPQEPASLEKAMAAYRKVLAARFSAYLASGLDGVAAYDFRDDVLEPAAELQAAYESAAPFLLEHFPGFGAALEAFPRAQPQSVSNKFYWIKLRVEDRPTFILVHQMVEAGANYMLMSQRQFFVGHTYDAAQAVALALPYGERTAVFYVNSAFTDKITGFFSGVAQSVGQSRMKEELSSYFGDIRKALK